MTKVEKGKCEKLMEEAIVKAKQAKEEFNRADQENDIVNKSVLLGLANNHLGYADGINQVLVTIGFKHERMKELGDLL